MDMFYLSTRENEAMIHFKIALFADGPVEGFVESGSVLRVNPFPRGPVLPARCLRIKPIYAKLLPGPEDILLGLNIPDPTASFTQSLRLSQMRLVPPQSFIASAEVGRSFFDFVFQIISRFPQLVFALAQRGLGFFAVSDISARPKPFLDLTFLVPDRH